MDRVETKPWLVLSQILYRETWARVGHPSLPSVPRPFPLVKLARRSDGKKDSYRPPPLTT